MSLLHPTELLARGKDRVARATPRDLAHVLIRALLALVFVDIVIVALTGGWNLLGGVDAAGFRGRALACAGLLALDFALLSAPRGGRRHGLLGMLLVLVCITHLAGWRMVGDSRWYFAYTHSLAFDGDVRLNNQYEVLGLMHERGAQPARETGFARSVFPVGAPLLWVAFVPAGHVGAWIRNQNGVATDYDGYALPYQNAASLGSLFLGWLGLVVLDRLLRRWFPPVLAFAACATTVFATFLVWYLAYQPLYAHPVTFLFVTLFLHRWLGTTRTTRAYALLGLLLGAATCARWQSVVFGVLLGVSVLRDLGAGRRRLALLGTLAASGGFLIGFAPQLLVWREIYGRLWIGVPQGSGFLLWRHPFLVEVLYSSRHGLFSWSPILILAALGLISFARRFTFPGLPLLGMLLLLVYVNATVADWWGGGAFGARRFESALPILAIGLAEALHAALELLRRRPGVFVALGIGAFVCFNLLLAEQYRSGRLPYDGTVSWEQVSHGASEDVFDAVGYPFSFPANWAFALRYDRPKTQYDLLVGKYLLHGFNNLEGIIDLGPDDAPFVGNGWTSPRTWPDRRQGRLALPPRAGVFVPTDRPRSLLVEVECAATSATSSLPVEVWLNGQRLGTISPSHDLQWRGVSAPESLWGRMNHLELIAADPTSRTPFLAVDRFRFTPETP